MATICRSKDKEKPRSFSNIYNLVNEAISQILHRKQEKVFHWVLRTHLLRWQVFPENTLIRTRKQKFHRIHTPNTNIIYIRPSTPISIFVFPNFMELFSKAKAVRLRAHNDKYLVADQDNQTIRQTRNRTSPKAIWVVEAMDGGIRLKSLVHGRYMSASDLPFLLGVTGNKVVQVGAEKASEWMVKWEPVREGFQVKLRSWCGTYLRGNGGTPPWRNSVTHDHPHTSATGKWILWDVEGVDLEGSGFDGSFNMNHLECLSSFASDQGFGSDPPSPTPLPHHNSSKTQVCFPNNLLDRTDHNFFFLSKINKNNLSQLMIKIKKVLLIFHSNPLIINRGFILSFNEKYKCFIFKRNSRSQHEHASIDMNS